MSTRCFLVEILLQRHDVEQTEVVYDFLFIFIIRGFYCFLMHFETFFTLMISRL